MNRKVCLLLLTLIVGLCIAFVPGVPTAHAAAGSSILNPGETLWAGQSLTSGNGYVLTMQGDGNLVLYTGTKDGWNNNVAPHMAIWQSGTYNRGGNRVVMQTDGNLVIYTPSNQAVWYSRTGGNGGSRLSVQTDGNVVVYSTTRWPLWYTNTTGFDTHSGQRYSYYYAVPMLCNHTFLFTSDTQAYDPTQNKWIPRNYNFGTSGGRCVWKITDSIGIDINDPHTLIILSSSVDHWTAITGAWQGMSACRAGLSGIPPGLLWEKVAILSACATGGALYRFYS
jgi:hypothetical protein